MAISPQMIAHLQGTTTLCMLAKVTERKPDGTFGDVVRVSNHTRLLTYNNEVYQPTYFEPTQINTKAGLSPDNADFRTLYADPFSPAKVRGHKWLGARVELNVVNYLGPTMGAAVRRVGILGEVDVGRFGGKVEYRSLGQLLNQTIGEVYTRDCRVVELGDAQCAVNLSGLTADTNLPITAAGSVTGAIDRQQFLISVAGIPAIPTDFYKRGRIDWLTGQNAGLREYTLWNTGNQLALFLPMYGPVAAGDTFSIITGCDRARATCRAKFNNVRRIRCFPDLPGRDKLFKFPE